MQPLAPCILQFVSYTTTCTYLQQTNAISKAHFWEDTARHLGMCTSLMSIFHGCMHVTCDCDVVISHTMEDLLH